MKAKNREIIPQVVLDLAHNEGYNFIHYAGMLDGVKAYSVGIVDINGHPMPIGLPHFILYDGFELSIVSGNDCLNILSRL